MPLSHVNSIDFPCNRANGFCMYFFVETAMLCCQLLPCHAVAQEPVSNFLGGCALFGEQSAVVGACMAGKNVLRHSFAKICAVP